LPFGECTERAVLVGDQHGDAYGDRKFSVLRRKAVLALRSAGVPTLSGWILIGWTALTVVGRHRPVRQLPASSVVVLTVVAWVGAVRRAGVRIGRAIHARMASSGNYPFPRIQRAVQGLTPQ
jgi:hypothetical protein